MTGYQAHIPRAIEIARIGHKWGLPVVIGGPGVSGAPDVCRGIFDVIFLGEAELTWPRFLRDWQKGNHLKEYRQVERLDLAVSPVPRWDSIAKDISKYELAAVQTTRGCPYDCDFCDVIHLFGRKPRHKPIENVLKEIEALQKLGAKRIFLCDDDFVGDQKWAKQFLRELLPLNNSFPVPMGYTTQATITAAADEELLQLMADCNFFQLHIGIETPNAEGLKEANKLQNLRTDLVESCKKIQAYGIQVRALMIVGFDSDDKTIFDEHIKFIEDAHITGVAINVLKAYPGTPLWMRLQKENRVLDMTGTYESSTKVVTNIIPKKMTRVELLEGYRALLEKVRSWDSIERRIEGFVTSVARQPKVRQASLFQRLMKARRLFGGGFLRRRRNVPPEVRQALRKVVRTVFRTNPFMLERAIGSVLQQVGETLVHPHQCKIIQKQIDDAIAGNLKLDSDPSAGQVPQDFRKKVRDVLPMIYDHLEAGMTYRTAVPEAMVSVITDFVVRWGGGFKEFEAHHHTYLKELCDRHTERWNANATARRLSEDPGLKTGLIREQLGSPQFVQALMVAVEQELRAAVNPNEARNADAAAAAKLDSRTTFVPLTLVRAQ